ncbi:hypothetical protein CYMTET_16380 [Cymbomonas tetramitiformis]|uniref:Uncharacterized protein n=1 Tax=Cymbomonas tetramitiformis TaxID=36881 RepID=A0AAE0L879_9CHLO|nr:hypothetical protein CYMTET_16380 [Cymbomonas tetramitiformis]
MLQLRVQQENNPGRHFAVFTAQLGFMEDKIHNTQANTVHSDVFSCWFCEFMDLRTKQNRKHAAKRGSRAWRAAGASAHVLSREATSSEPGLLNGEAGHQQAALGAALQDALCEVQVQGGMSGNPEEAAMSGKKRQAIDFLCLFDLKDGWNDSPRILVKVMWALAEAIRAPQALRDRMELRKRRGGAGGTGSRGEPTVRAEREEGRVGAAPLVEHLGLEVGIKDGQFKVDLSADWKSPVRPRHLLSTASRERRWVVGTGASSLQRAVPVGVPGRATHLILPARTLLRDRGAEELGNSGQAFPASTARPGVPATAQRGMLVEQPRHLAPAHHHAPAHRLLPLRLGGRSQSEGIGAGFLERRRAGLPHHASPVRCDHAYGTDFPEATEGKDSVVEVRQLGSDAHAGAFHFEGRSALMRRMRRLWIRWDSHKIELQAWYNWSEWADRLSRNTDVDDWPLNCR